MKTRIVLCADDYGQDPDISQAIINLLGQGRISATSCLVNTQDWLTHAKWLAPFKESADIGLHFNLTEGAPLSEAYRHAYGESMPGLSSVLINALLRRLDSQAIEAECHAQIDRFIEGMGCYPRYVDGHQHVHQFPVVREALIRVYRQRLAAHQVYLRWVNAPIRLRDIFQNPKKIIIQWMGARPFKMQLDENNIPHNQSFAGIYSFSKSRSYADYFRGFLGSIRDGGLIMCHPGLDSPNSNDVIAHARGVEYAYLSSAQFLADCAAYHIEITRYI